MLVMTLLKSYLFVCSMVDEEAKQSLPLEKCFPISEFGVSNKTNYAKKFFNYKSPIPKTKLTRALLTENVCGKWVTHK